MTVIFWILISVMLLVFAVSLITSADGKNINRKEDLLRAVVVLAMIVTICKIWR